MLAWRQDLNHRHATLVPDWALPQRRADEFFITLTIIFSTFEGRWFRRRHVQKLGDWWHWSYLLEIEAGSFR